jgi:hypothetical protein
MCHSLVGDGDVNPTASDLKPRKKLKITLYCSASVNSTCFATMRATKENQPGAKAASQRLGYLGMLKRRASANKTAQGPYGLTRKFLTSSTVIVASPLMPEPWPISARVNKPENDDPSIVEPIALALRLNCTFPTFLARCASLCHLAYLDYAVGMPFPWCCYR